MLGLRRLLLCIFKKESNVSKNNILCSVGVLLIKNVEGELQILIQKRIRNMEDSSNGKWEVPQGKIDKNFGLVLSAEKETYEESGLELIGLSKEKSLPQRFCSDVVVSSSFKPFWCTEILGNDAQLVLFVIGECRGTPTSTKEATDHKWVTSQELKLLLDDGEIFSMDHDALRAWSENPINPEINSKSKVNNKYPIIAIDCGGILLRYDDKILFNNLSVLLGCSDELVADVLINEKVRSELHSGLKKPKDVWSRLREVSKSNISDLDLREAWLSSVVYIHENISWLSQIRKQFPELLLVAFTNIDPMIEDLIMRDCTNWVSNFDIWFSSWRMGVSKPSPLFYEKVEQFTCIKKRTHILLIDDREKNRVEAQKKGWKTVEVSSNQHLESLNIKDIVAEWINNL
jgi:8-oxo-dGTP pyrophosphatase MutT (NUDIX family)/FMN phosphatase YigB (HAD superfamily)